MTHHFITHQHAQRNVVLSFLSVCPFICPMPVLCLNNGHIVIPFDNLVGASFLVFLSTIAITSFQSAGDLGWEKFAIFHWNWHSPRKQYETGVWLPLVLGSLIGS